MGKPTTEQDVVEATVAQVEQKGQDALPTQVLKVSDAYGSPILFASAMVYILMRLLVKPYLSVSLAKKGVPKDERGMWVMRATFLPGLLAACVVDFGPVAKALGVPLHWIAVIPVGALFYAAGGMVMHEVLKRVDPIGMLVEKLGGKTDEEHKQEAEEVFQEVTGSVDLAELHRKVDEANAAQE